MYQIRFHGIKCYVCAYNMILNCYNETVEFSNEWQEDGIRIYKGKGNKSKCSNERGINT